MNRVPRLGWIVAFCLLAAVAMRGIAQETSTEEKADPAADEQAVRAAIASYVDTFNKHDPKALAAHWTLTGEFITPAGKQLKGREQLEQEFTAYFADEKDVKLELLEPTVQFLSPNVVVEHGTAIVTRGDAEPAETNYEAIHVRTAKGWKMDSVREVESQQPQSHYEQLKDLEWMIGEWVDADDEATVETTCKWTKNQNFITRSFKVSIDEQIGLEGTQIIGWDPVLRTIRSWMFDSQGGFGVGTWSKNGNGWLVRGLRVTPDGQRGSSTTLIEQVDDNSFTTRIVGRQLDGELMPNIGPIKVVRK
jgi:uncharacterized protein (TIGR02246 family)